MAFYGVTKDRQPALYNGIGRRPLFVIVDSEGLEMSASQWNDCRAVERHPEKVSGAWVFRSTRVPVAALFENLKDGATVGEFLEWFPGVSRDQVDAVLDHEAASLRTVVAS